MSSATLTASSTAQAQLLNICYHINRKSRLASIAGAE